MNNEANYRVICFESNENGFKHDTEKKKRLSKAVGKIQMYKKRKEKITKNGGKKKKNEMLNIF